MVKLPIHIKNSTVLTIAQKEILAHVDHLPVVDPSFTDDVLKNIFQYYSLTPHEMDVEVHRYAAQLLSEGKVDDAWQVLLTNEVV